MEQLWIFHGDVRKMPGRRLIPNLGRDLDLDAISSLSSAACRS
jgi:hypothetical protein